jgi:hypothetical protein
LKQLRLEREIERIAGGDVTAFRGTGASGEDRIDAVRNGVLWANNRQQVLV